MTDSLDTNTAATPVLESRQHANHGTTDENNAASNQSAEERKTSPDPAEPQSEESDESIFSSNWEETVESFDDMNLRGPLLHGVYSFGFEKPSLIQMKAVMPIASRHDVIAQAQSGSGKTGAFAIGTLQNIDPENPVCQIMAMSPTRELALQTEEVFASIGQRMKVETVSAIGGTSMRVMSQKIRNGAQIVCATPGRALHLLSKDILKLDHLKTLIFDECDEMFNRGFIEDVYKIFQYVPKDVQVVLVSATMNKEMLTMTKKFMRNPIRILIPDADVTLDGIKQFYVNCEEQRWKLDVLCDLYGTFSINQCVIFANKKSTVEWLANELEKADFTVSYIHGDLTSQERNLRIAEFRSGSSRVLLSSDLIGRGINVRGVSCVINYDLPMDHASYIHRIGRCGRFGRRGVAINLVTPRDIEHQHAIEQYYSTQVEQLPQDVADIM